MVKYRNLRQPISNKLEDALADDPTDWRAIVEAVRALEKKLDDK